MIKIDLWRVLKSCRNIKSIFTCWSRRNIARLGKTGQPCNVLIIYSESRSLRVFYTTVTIGLYIIYILDIRTAIYYRRAQDWLGSGWGCVKQDITKTRQWFTRGLCVSIPLRSTTVGRSQHLRITNIRKCPLWIAGEYIIYILYIMPINTRSGLSCDLTCDWDCRQSHAPLVHIWSLTTSETGALRHSNNNAVHPMTYGDPNLESLIEREHSDWAARAMTKTRYRLQALNEIEAIN